MILLKALAVALVLLALALAAFWFFGAREPADLTVRFDPAAIGPDPDAYLARSEAAVPNLRPSAAKAIVWADPDQRGQTPFAVVFLHGFSASRQEVRPLPDIVAKGLGANLVFARMTGHGRDGAAMAEASVNAWINDTAEALAIGRRVGRRLLVIGVSTGGTLATIAASRPALARDIAGLVLISPNYAINDPLAWALEIPYARTLIPLLGGRMRGFAPTNPLEAEYWTTRYPSEALAPLGALMRVVRAIDPARIAVPVLAFVAPGDRVVKPAATRRTIAQWGGPHRLVEVTDSTDPSQHVLAGAVLSPGTTEPLADEILRWARTL